MRGAEGGGGRRRRPQHSLTRHRGRRGPRQIVSSGPIIHHVPSREALVGGGRAGSGEAQRGHESTPCPPRAKAGASLGQA